MDKDHKDIITGHLKIIDNNKIRKLFSKDQKYHESKIADYQKAHVFNLSVMNMLFPHHHFLNRKKL